MTIFGQRPEQPRPPVLRKEPAIEDDGFITVFPPPEQFCVAAEGAGRDAASPCLGPRSNSTDIAMHINQFSQGAPKPDAPNSPAGSSPNPSPAGLFERI